MKRMESGEQRGEGDGEWRWMEMNGGRWWIVSEWWVVHGGDGGYCMEVDGGWRTEVNGGQ